MKKILSLMLSKVLLNLSKSERLNFTEVTNQMTSIKEMIFWLNDLSYFKLEELLAKKELLNADVKLATQELNRLKSELSTLGDKMMQMREANGILNGDREDLLDQIFKLNEEKRDLVEKVSKLKIELNVPQPPNPTQEDTKSQLPEIYSVKDLLAAKYELTPEETIKINQSQTTLL